MIESLMALLIVSVGLLGLMSMNASAAASGSDARFRSEAAQLADELLARMSVANRASVAADFATGGAAFTQWLNGRVRAANTGLPAAAASVEFGVVPGDALSVRITVRWTPARQASRDAAGVLSAQQRARQHVTVSSLAL